MNNKNSRRSFLKKATLTSAAVTSSPYILASSFQEPLQLKRNYSTNTFRPNDHINLALIGTGIQGIYDTQSALKVDGVKLVAACDLYTGRLERAKELWGDSIYTTRDYRDILNRKDIDAVIIATPDHWHQKITNCMSLF